MMMFFFKQKTAYEMRISDWSSDVCSSDLPGGGGIVRSVRMLGLMKALPLLTEGRRLTPAQALSEGLVNELAATKDDMITRAEAWIAANPAAQIGRAHV